jgi:hypothetical protein
MNATIDAQIEAVRRWGDPWGGYTFGEDQNGVVASSATSGPSSGAGGATGGEPAPAPDHSDTNTQVEGVDEADFVKTDGNFLYVLHGQDLAIMHAWPASEFALGSMTRIEGQPFEMFLADGQAVIYSYVNGDAVFTEAGLLGHDDGYGYYYYPSLTKVTVLSLDGTQATTVSELYFEGSYLSSRRIGSSVRTVLSGGYYAPVYQTWPNMTYESQPDNAQGWIDAYEELRWQNTKIINQAKLSDFIPHRFVRIAGKLTQLEPSCDSYYVPPPGSTGDGLTQIQSFDLSALQNGVLETQVVGSASTVYANAESLYLAGQSWRDPMLDVRAWDEPTSTSRTLLHKFDIATDPMMPIYRASGAVSGWVLNQFSMDEKDGVLRLATTDQLASIDNWETVNKLYTVGERMGHLAVLGRLDHLAPGETIQSARFVNDRGYVVTFRQVDPLFVIDLSNPEAPTVMAELKIPGFSEYMHPLDDGTHLLTIGRDGDDSGQVFGTALQIFDVSNPTAPQLTHKYLLGEGYSEAEHNHKAFTLYNGTLAIPMVGYDYNYGFSNTSLELFDIGATSGIQHKGSINHTQFYQANDPSYCYYYGYGVRRGVFIEDHIYTISEGGVTVHQTSNLTTPVASVAMPLINYTECYY